VVPDPSLLVTSSALVPFDDLLHLVEPEAPRFVVRKGTNNDSRTNSSDSVGNSQDGIAVFVLDRHRYGPLAVQA
jgi:hypothetical protein